MAKLSPEFQEEDYERYLESVSAYRKQLQKNLNEIKVLDSNAHSNGAEVNTLPTRQHAEENESGNDSTEFDNSFN